VKQTVGSISITETIAYSKHSPKKDKVVVFIAFSLGFKMTQNYVFKKNAFRIWFIIFCATSSILVPIYYYGWQEAAGEGKKIYFL
jgi:hypothetical protein